MKIEMMPPLVESNKKELNKDKKGGKIKNMLKKAGLIAGGAAALVATEAIQPEKAQAEPPDAIKQESYDPRNFDGNTARRLSMERAKKVLGKEYFEVGGKTYEISPTPTKGKEVAGPLEISADDYGKKLHDINNKK